MRMPFRINLVCKKDKASNLARRLNPSFIALFVQLQALLAMLLLAAILPPQILSIFAWAVIQGAIAALISYQLKMPIWWLPIHLFFIPLIVAALTLAIPPLWFLGAFLFIALIYGKTYQTQVPLYLTSKQAAIKLAELLPKQKNFSFIDLGCGYGGLLNNLGKARPDGVFHGIEAAPIPFLFGKIHTMSSTPCKTIRWGDFWKHDLSPYDVVYAYLSPVPMKALWRKAHREMQPGSILISNSFTISEVEPEEIIKLDDLTGSTLYLWRIGGQKE